MIYGIGIDLVEIKRIKLTIEARHNFADRLLTIKEQILLSELKTFNRQAEFIAGRWAAKEAFSKAFGTGIGSQLSFQDIEVLRSKSGQPYIKTDIFSGNIHISITHTADYAAAYVVLEEKEDQ